MVIYYINSKNCDTFELTTCMVHQQSTMQLLNCNTAIVRTYFDCNVASEAGRNREKSGLYSSQKAMTVRRLFLLNVLSEARPGIKMLCFGKIITKIFDGVDKFDLEFADYAVSVWFIEKP